MKVLISPEYGIGWSTWNYIDLAFDPDIINMFEMGVDEEFMEEYIVSLGYGRPYMDGYCNCKIVEIPKGTKFRIIEYDGAERIEYYDDTKWLIAQ